jgi:hypothetical protein
MQSFFYFFFFFPFFLNRIFGDFFK